MIDNNPKPLIEIEYNAMARIIEVIELTEATTKHINQVMCCNNSKVPNMLFDAHTTCSAVRNGEAPMGQMLEVIETLNQTRIKIEIINAVLQNPIETPLTRNISVAYLNSLKIMKHESDYKQYER
jgi:hypothetical protein